MRSEDPSSKTFDTRVLRSAFGLFPTGVAIITAFSREKIPLGMTVSSFNTVSLDPPLILFSILNSAKAFDEWMTLNEFCVNFLAEEHDGLSTAFARPLSDKWKDVAWRQGKVSNTPVLEDGMAHFECTVWDRYPGGDHTIIVGRVAHFEYAQAQHRSPLVFCGGKYRKIEADNTTQSPQHSHEWLLGW